MALVLYDRVQQTGTANTTVSFTLSGSVTGYQSFSVVGNGNTTYYAATDTSGNWEVGLGTYSTTGPTLTRTTILSSSNSGSAVTFSGTVTVFVTYPSSTSVYEDTSGNVSALGTITSGVWNGSTIPVAYGGTGVTSSSGASSVVLRNANQNITFNNYVAGFAATTASGGTTVLTAASARNQILIGSTTHTFQMPNATTLQLGQSFLFVNNSSGVLTVVDNASATLDTIPSGAAVQLGATNISTSAGTFGIYSFLPGSYNFNNTTATFNNATISDAVWNGTAIASGYGGTGLTTFSAANNALYSTSASALAAGTLPVAAGGTGQTTANAAFNALAPSQTGNSGKYLTTNGTDTSWGSLGNAYSRTSFTATAGQTTFTVAYTVGLIEVYVNGVLLNGADYTASSGTSVILGVACNAGNIVEAIAFTSFSVASAVSSFSAGTTGLTPSVGTTGNVTLGGTLAVANGGTGVTTSTGSGANVLGTSPTLTTPTLTSPTITGAVVSAMASSVITRGTAVASTSGTSIDFTGIPSWVKCITVIFNEVSTNGTSGLLVQLGSTTIQTSGYLSTAMDVANTGTGILTSTAGMAIRTFAATFGIIGTMTISNISGNIWIASGVVGRTTQDSNQMLAGNVTLSGVLDRLRITTVNGTSTFDAGSINILYE